MTIDLENLNDDFKELNPQLSQMMGEKKKLRSKYRNVLTSMEGMHFDSGKEAADAQKFMLGVRVGEWIAYLHHVNVKLPGDIKMELDHVIVNNKLEIEVFETKAVDKKTGKYIMTRDWKNKAKLFKATYGKEIKII